MFSKIVMIYYFFISNIDFPKKKVRKCNNIRLIVVYISFDFESFLPLLDAKH